MKKRTGRRHSMEIQNEIKNNEDDMRDVIVSVEHLKTYFNAGKTWGKKQVVNQQSLTALPHDHPVLFSSGKYDELP